LIRLTVPKRDKPALAALVRMPAERMHALISALAEIAPASSLLRMSMVLGERLDVPREELYGILTMLASLYGIRHETGASIDEFVEELIRAAKAEGDIEPADANWTRVAESLAKIFAADQALGVASKASELLSESERVLCPENCRVVTDIRPVFLDGADERPAAALIQHVLKIAYHDATDLKEFYVALDGDDLRVLQAILDRAVVKENTLRDMVRESNLKVVGD
jgi:hypothetical protein